MKSLTPRRMIFALAIVTALTVIPAGRAEAAADLRTEFTAPVNLVNNEATRGQTMTLKIRVTNIGNATSVPVRISILKYDQTCSGYPKPQPRAVGGASATYHAVLALAPNTSSDELTFEDPDTDLNHTAGDNITVNSCYKVAIQTSSGGYYTDSANANNSATKVIKYVASATAPSSAPLELTISSVTLAATACAPGSQYVEAAINATQQTTARATVSGFGSPVTRDVSLMAGANKVRVTVPLSASGAVTAGFKIEAPRPNPTVQATRSQSFTIAKCKGAFALSAPAPGESVPAGGTYTVRWTSKGIPTSEPIVIKVYDGQAWHNVLVNTPNDGSQQVTMPTRAATNARVAFDAPRFEATTSARDFTLAGGGGGGTASITIMQPAGGESVTAGQNVTVRWTSTGVTGQVRLALLVNGSFFRNLTSNITNDGLETVTIPADTSATTNARINIVSEAASTTSEAFRIQNGGGDTTTPTITVTAPAAGANFAAGATTTVTWNSSGNVGSTVNLKISINNGTYKNLDLNVANDGSETVELPKIYKHSDALNQSPNPGELISTSNARIEVSSTSTTAKGTSGQFSLKVPAVSFRDHLYPKLTGDCGMCHPSSGNGMINPQLARAADDSLSSVDERVAPVIPFSTDITAPEMLTRFKQVKAVSSQYSNALGKRYVVPSNHTHSGLHYKVHESSSQIFSSSMSIDTVPMMIRDWITLWIRQGAAP